MCHCLDPNGQVMHANKMCFVRSKAWTHNTATHCNPSVSCCNANSAHTDQAKVAIKLLLVTRRVYHRVYTWRIWRLGCCNGSANLLHLVLWRCQRRLDLLLGFSHFAIVLARECKETATRASQLSSIADIRQEAFGGFEWCERGRERTAMEESRERRSG